MLFNSLDFFVFFTIVSGIYWLLKKNCRSQTVFLVIASLFFYAYQSLQNLPVLAYSIMLNFYCGIKIAQAKRTGMKKFFLSIGFIGNIGILFFYKYSNFVLYNITQIFPQFNSTYLSALCHVSLPLGISFFTFQGMAYIIDIYRKEVSPERNFIRFSLFKSFFAQLISGPIVRAKYFLPQIPQKKTFSLKNLEAGSYIIVWGIVKKVVIADNLALIADSYFSHPTFDFFATWLAIYAFAWQIYCDFSGYCDIAIGCAKILDYRLPLNFMQPYLAPDITVFWRRWNITLSNWFKDYFFISLGGSRINQIRYYFNLLLTMFVAGIWHGAEYTFVIWGVYHGVLLVSHKLYMKYIKIKIPLPLGIILTFNAVCLGWVFFRARTVSEALLVLQAAIPIMKSSLFFHIPQGAFTVFLFLVPLAILQALERRFSLKENFINFPSPVKFFFVLSAVLSIFLLGENANAFIYFDF